MAFDNTNVLQVGGIQTSKPYIVLPYQNKQMHGRTIRLTVKMYGELYKSADTSDEDVAYLKRACKVTIYRKNPKFWQRKKRVLHVNAVSGWEKGRFSLKEDSEIAQAKIGASDSIYKIFEAYKHDNGVVDISFDAKNTPLWSILTFRHPSEAWNLSVIFLYWSTFVSLVFNLVGEGYNWPTHFRNGMDRLVSLVGSYLP